MFEAGCGLYRHVLAQRPVGFKLFFGEELEGTITFHIDGVSELAVLGRENGDDDAVFMVDRFFNTDAFVPTEQVPKGVYGNAGRGLISGPALNSSDFSVIKEFVFREPYKVQFRSEFFNAFNDTNFSVPNGTQGDPNFGTILGMDTFQRQIQFGLKLIY